MNVVRLFSWCVRWLGVAGMAIMPAAQAAVTAGGFIVVGYDDFQDSVTLVTTETIQQGEVIYLTNNGWSNATSSFNGAHSSQGAGNESLLKLTVTANLAAGTIISTSNLGSGLWSWTNTGLVPGQVGGLGSFSNLELDNYSDQIYLFQGAENNPLLNPSHFIFALHFGNDGNANFSDADDVYDGAVPPGLSTALGTALALPPTFHGDDNGSNSSFGLNLSSPTFSALQSQGGTKEQWLQALASSSDPWIQGATLPSGGSLLIHAPEPSRVVLVAFGVLVPLVRRRRKA